jgi:hypothetical protein
MLGLAAAALGILVHEGYFAARRAAARSAARQRAEAVARELGLPLVVIGRPSPGACGDLTLSADVGRPLPLPDGCCVVAVEPGGLDDAHDPGTGWAEIERISDGRAYAAPVEPWTLAGLLALRRAPAPPDRFTVAAPADWRAPLPR